MTTDKPRRPPTLAEMTPGDVAVKVARVAGDADVKYRADGSARLTGPLPLTIEWTPAAPPKRRRGMARPVDDEVRAAWDAAWRLVYAQPNRYAPEYRVIARIMSDSLPMSVSRLRWWRGRLHLEPPPR
jgi:hypothetical protein